jgi:trans-aconitate methyltransferase
MPYADVAPYFKELTVARRVHAHVRYASAPLEAVAALVPAGVRRVVELGCSTGVFANVLKARRPELDVTGVDGAAAKVEAASRTVCGRPGLAFVEDDAFAYVDRGGPFEVVVVVDMLYLLPPDRQDELISKAAAKLRAGGCLIVKEMTDRPAWKRRWCAFQERLAVRALGLTAGEGVFLRPGEDYRRVMEGAGLAVETFNMDKGYPYPHVALRGRKEPNV